MIQLNRNKKTLFSNCNTEEEYLPTISNRLIEKLKELDVQIICVLVHASQFAIFERSKIRNQINQLELRYNTLEEVMKEQLAEETQWKKIISDENIFGIAIDSEMNSPEEMVSKFIDFIDSIYICKQKELVKRR